MHDTDTNLLSAAKLDRNKGGLEAFEKILFRYEGLIYHIAIRYFASPEDALYAAQEAAVKIYNGLSRIDLPEGGSLKTWICIVTANACQNGLRKHRPENASLSGEAMSVALPSTKGNTAAGERTQEIIEALYKLPDDKRMVVILRDIQGLCYDDLAEALDISVDMAKSRLSQARAELYEYLEGKRFVYGKAKLEVGEDT